MAAKPFSSVKTVTFEAEAGEGGGPKQSVLPALHRFRSPGTGNHAPHLIGMVDGRMILKMPNGASLILPRSAAMRLRSMSSTPGQTDLRRPSGPKPYATSVNDQIIFQSRLWSISLGQETSSSFWAGRSRSCSPLIDQRVPLEISALRMNVLRSMSKGEASQGLFGRGGRGMCMSWAMLNGKEGDVGIELLQQGQQAGLEAAESRLRQMRKRVVLASSLQSLMACWPVSATQFLPSTFWAQYLRPKTWAPTRQMEKQTRKERVLQQSGKTKQLGGASATRGGLVPGATGQLGVEDAAAAQQAEDEERYIRQMQVQAEAEARERAEQQAKAFKWQQQHWLQCHVRAAAFYALQTTEAKEPLPIMRFAGLSPLESTRKGTTFAAQGRFVAGLPDAVQELFPQMPVELTKFTEVPQRPEDRSSAKKQKRKPLVAHVTRIRGSAPSVYNFASLPGGPRDDNALTSALTE